MLYQRVMRLALLATALALVGGVTVAQSTPTAHSAAAVKVKVGSTKKLGRFLVDQSGRTLYLFEKDKNGKSACYGQCAAGWPPLVGTPSPGSGVTASKLATTKRRDGKTQVTYNGHPLYRYAGDSSAGQTNGEGSKAFGASWYVVAPSGKKIDKS